MTWTRCAAALSVLTLLVARCLLHRFTNFHYYYDDFSAADVPAGGAGVLGRTQQRAGLVPRHLHDHGRGRHGGVRGKWRLLTSSFIHWVAGRPVLPFPLLCAGHFTVQFDVALRLQRP